MEPKSLSIIIPAFRQEKTIVSDIRNIEKVLKQIRLEYEMIVVIDGIVDKTYSKVKRITNPKIKAYAYKENKGKGYAIKYGIEKAKGGIIGFIDAGKDLDPASLLVLIDYMKLHNADIVVGSKTHPDSKVNYPFYRKLISLGGRFVTQFLFGFNILDTQVGLKIFKGSVAKNVFPRLHVRKFAFDIEMLAMSEALGYSKIYEAPIKLNFRQGSISYKDLSVILLRTFWDTLGIFYRIKIIRSYK